MRCRLLLRLGRGKGRPDKEADFRGVWGNGKGGKGITSVDYAHWQAMCGKRMVASRRRSSRHSAGEFLIFCEHLNQCRVGRSSIEHTPLKRPSAPFALREISSPFPLLPSNFPLHFHSSFKLLPVVEHEYCRYCVNATGLPA